MGSDELSMASSLLQSYTAYRPFGQRPTHLRPQPHNVHKSGFRNLARRTERSLRKTCISCKQRDCAVMDVMPIRVHYSSLYRYTMLFAEFRSHNVIPASAGGARVGYVEVEGVMAAYLEESLWCVQPVNGRLPRTVTLVYATRVLIFSSTKKNQQNLTLR